MLDSKWAVYTMTIFSLDSTSDSIVMARITVVGATTTEPKCNGAAVSALVVDVIVAMLVTFGNTSSYKIGGALGAHEVFSPEITSTHGHVVTVCHATEVRLFALPATVVGALEHGKFS